MFSKKILKELIIVTISFCFLLTFSFMAGCRGPEAAEIVETTEEIAEEAEEGPKREIEEESEKKLETEEEELEGEREGNP